jgi:tetratricopeptide (TPR) repeat protein
MLKQNSISPVKHRLALCVLVALVGLLLCASARILAQGGNEIDAERKLAFQLLQDGKFAEAQQKFEKLAAANPSDGQAQFGLGFSVMATSKNISDEAARRQARIRARNALLRAKELGVRNDLLETALAALPPDGSEAPAFSKNPEADKAMQEGEAAFTRGDYDKALEAYERALKIDPQLYHAALFIGDMYFQKRQADKAGEWYGRAIAIDPDRETAYRYWSDALLKDGKMDEARAKAIEAIIAEPYNRMAYNGLVQWAQTNNATLGHPRIDQPKPTMGSSTDSSGKTTITVDPKALDPKQGAAYYWSFYDLTRSTYPSTFQKEFPDEKAYRHSLKEEATALRVVAEMVLNDLKSGKLKSVDDPSLANLLRLYQADMIEPYVLFARADNGISQDYVAYRKANRDKLRRYWTEIVSGKK